MPLSWNEIKDRAYKFSADWADVSSERSEAKTFWDEFFGIFGITRRRVASFEMRVTKLDGRDGLIDLLWKGKLLIEHKSRGKNLDTAYRQALAYFQGLKEADLPQYVLVSDFDRFRLYDLDSGEQEEFGLGDLVKRIRLFGFIAGYEVARFREQDPVNIEAALRMGLLHDKLKEIGYPSHPLEVYLVRLLFCLFAEDTSIFNTGQFQDFLELKTSEDGSDLAPKLAQLFEVLDTPVDERLKNLDEHLASFSYINGGLFRERLPQASFDSQMRQLLVDCCQLNWSRISPAIFGALFQSIMSDDPNRRRNIGAHYTSEANIMKIIKPLFLDDLRKEFSEIHVSDKKLEEFHNKLSEIRMLDPACGCGNFLVIAYRELRELELDVLLEINKNKFIQSLDVSQFRIRMNVDQFYGIEKEEFPAQIAQTAMWLTDHQMNLRVSEKLGKYFARLPLSTAAHIVNDNALTIDWGLVVEPTRLTYILGNPPFVGKQYQNVEQKRDMQRVFSEVPNAGVLDYVTAWYKKAAEFMRRNKSIRAAFVSTNSITQGEQAGVLWRCLLHNGVAIDFAHRTFVWSNEASGIAAVHCVIIGFALEHSDKKWIYDYEESHLEPFVRQAKNINPYLVDAPDIVMTNRSSAICSVPEIIFGSMPNDGGHLLLDRQQRDQLIAAEPEAAQFVRRIVGSKEFINGIERYCLWLSGISPATLRSLPLVRERIERVRAHRESSPRDTTRELAESPTEFGENRQPTTDYLLIPSASTERRKYIPMAFMPPEVIASNLVGVVPGAGPYHMGVLSSQMHMAWVRTVAGRLKSDFRYSNKIVYNNFPWPLKPGDKQRLAVVRAAQGVLEARSRFPESTLADLYDPDLMPPALMQAHRKLDAAVDAAYGRRGFVGDSDRMSFLIDLYMEYVAPLPGAATGRRRSNRR